MILFKYSILAFAMLGIWGPWLWRYHINPWISKKKLNKLLEVRPDIKKLITIEKFLYELYKGVNSKSLSQSERKRLDLHDDSFTYGEIEFLPFFSVIESVKPSSGEVFYDLGSGAGKAVFTAASFFDFSKVCGIEKLPMLHALSNAQIEKAKRWVSEEKTPCVSLSNLSTIHFIDDDFLTHNFLQADIVFINATCLDFYAWETLQEKLMHLKAGSRVIVTTKKINKPAFQLLNQTIALMSWGMNSVNTYIKKDMT